MSDAQKKLTPEQVAQLLYQVGFRGPALVQMLAIGGRESGYDALAHRTSSPGQTGDQATGDFGLFQINQGNFRTLAPQLGITSVQQLLDPVVNAKAAWILSHGGTSWNAWGMGPKGWMQGGDPLRGVNLSAATDAVNNAAAQGLLGQDYNDPGAAYAGAAGVSGVGNGAFPGQMYQGAAGLIPGSASAAAWAGGVVGSGIPGFAPGPGATAAVAPGLGPDASYADIEKYIRANYHYMAGFLDIPEVRDVLIQAARDGIGKDELQGRLSTTQWWKDTSASVRTWTELLSEDPASARQQVNAAAATISDQAKTYGITLSPDELAALATDASKFGWTSAQTIDNILRHTDWGSVTGGTLTATRDQMKALAAKYLIRVSDLTADDYAQKIASGEMTQNGAQSIFQQQAKARFNYIAPLIDQGITPADYFAPARDAIASTLEMGSAGIDMTDPKWLAMLEVRDAKTNEPRAATLNEAMLSARKVDGGLRWANTKNAQDLGAQMGVGLAQRWGQPT